MQPLNDYIFLTYNKEKDTKEGIILSDVSKDKPAVFTVFAVGDLVKKVSKDDEIVIDPFIPRELTVDGKKLYVVKEKDIFAKK